MEINLGYALTSVVLISSVSLIGVAALSLKHDLLERVIFLLVSLASGALLGDALIHLLPEAFETTPAVNVSLATLLGIVSFFALEKFLRWHHSHGTEQVHEIDTQNPAGCEQHRIKPLGFMVLASDGVHNFIDGFIIAASYTVSVEVGIATTAAVLMHEIPQEIGDFGLLLHAGFSKGKALLINFLSALTAIVGALAAFLVAGYSEKIVGLVLAFAAGSFIYIAGADLIPELHKVSDVRKSLLQFTAMITGIFLMLLLLQTENGFGDPEVRSATTFNKPCDHIVCVS